MTKKEYFPFFLDFKIAFINLSKRDQSNLIMSIIEYAETGEVPKKQSKQLEYSFEYVKVRIDKSFKKSSIAKSNGKLGGRPPRSNTKDDLSYSTKITPVEIKAIEFTRAKNEYARKVGTNPDRLTSEQIEFVKNELLNNTN